MGQEHREGCRGKGGTNVGEKGAEKDYKEVVFKTISCKALQFPAVTCSSRHVMSVSNSLPIQFAELRTLWSCP